jgi:lysozyme family protein
MGAVFSKVASLIIKAEGYDKIVNSPSDKGGLTKYGISQRSYPDVDIINLTEEKALLILETDFWQKYNLEMIESQSIANQLFFMIVNMGAAPAVHIIQIAVNACGRGLIHATVDGVMGTETINAINSLSDGWFSNRIRLEAINHYLRITDEDESQIPNFRGWVRRALNQ